MTAAVARMDDYRNRDLAAEVNRLRALVLVMSDALDLAERNASKAAYLAACDAYSDGWDAGYRHGARIAEAQFRPVAQRLLNQPTLEELNWLRWNLRGQPRTRETFANPHPDDYPGQDGAR